MQVLPGGRVLASADESGMVAACDLRMLGGAPGEQRLLWSLRPPGGGITCLEAGLHPLSGAAARLLAHSALAGSPGCGARTVSGGGPSRTSTLACTCCQVSLWVRWSTREGDERRG